MQRIINGHYADPDSIRDITGITGEEFGVIIESLQAYYKTMQLLVEATPEQRKVLHDTTAEIQGEEKNVIDQEIFKDEDTLSDIAAEKQSLLYKILHEINQPDPGAKQF